MWQNNFPMNFNPYQQSVQPQQNFVPKQEIMKANGKQSIDNLRLAPNSSVLVLDTTAPLVWLCSSDSVGSMTAKPYVISECVETQPESEIEKRVTAIENAVKELQNEQSNVNESDTKQVVEQPRTVEKYNQQPQSN